MRIYRQGKSWKVRDRTRGDRVRSFPTKRQAEQFVAFTLSQRAANATGLPVVKPSLTYNEMCDLYLVSFATKSSEWFRGCLKPSRTTFGNVELRNLDPEAVGAWLHALELSPNTKRHYLGVMRQVLNQAVEWEYLHRSPLRPKTIKLPRVEHVRDIRPFESWNEVLQIADNTGKYSPMIRFACATGLRPSEWLALRWCDLDVPNRTLIVHRTYTELHGESNLGKTPGSMRMVTLSARALEALAELPTPLFHDQLVFPSQWSGHLSLAAFRAGAWKHAFTELPYRPPYAMRHTYATLGLAAGCSLDWLSTQMGHSNAGITRLYYAKFLKEYDARQLAFLDQIGATR